MKPLGRREGAGGASRWRPLLVGLAVVLLTAGPGGVAWAAPGQEFRRLPVMVWDQTLPRVGVTTRVVRQARDGGFFIAGWIEGDGATPTQAYLIKLTPEGQREWEVVFPHVGDTITTELVVTRNGDVVLAGYTRGLTALPGPTDPWQSVYLARVSPTGGRLWAQALGQASSQEGTAVIETGDGGLLVGATAYGDRDERIPTLLKTDANGVLQWEAPITLDWDEAGTIRAWGTVEDVAQVPQGMLVTGFFGEPQGGDRLGEWLDREAYVAVVSDRAETTRWQTRVGVRDPPVAVRALERGGAAVGSAFYLARLDTAGRLLWESKSVTRRWGVSWGLRQVHALGFQLTGTSVPRVEPPETAALLHLVETDDTGRLRWERVFPIQATEVEDLQPTSDGGFVAVVHEGRWPEPQTTRVIRFRTEIRFIRGDANLDWVVDVSDAYRVLLYLYSGGVELPCEDAGDADDNGQVGLTDVLVILNHLFLEGPPPREPYVGGPGEDPPTPEDTLQCG